VRHHRLLEDDWADCPIEVIELKSELRSATAPAAPR